MTITPSGSPSWVRTNDLTHYGGDVNKENYLSRGAIDALTDVDASQFARLAADVAALQRVMPFCTITYVCDDVTPGSPTVEYVAMQTGISSNYLGSTPPSGFPALTRNGNGDVSITFASTYSDVYNVSGSFSISHAIPSLLSSSSGEAISERISPVILKVRAFDSAGAALSNARVCVTVW
jgi:hypothetical protein